MFGLDKKDFAHRGYFYVIHAWLFHRRMVLSGQTGNHFYFWESVWNWFKVPYV